MRFSIARLLIVVVGCAVVCWIVAALTPRHGSGLLAKNVPLNSACPLERLPGNATDVAYHYGGGRNPNTFYEFNIDENDFLTWVSSLPRFKQVAAPKNLIYRCDSKLNSREAHQISEGYFYQWIHPTDGDCGEHVAYDKLNGRAYYRYHLF